MGYYNCGVTYAGKRIATKKALKEHVKNGDFLRFDGTSMFDTARSYTTEDLPIDVVLVVVGPDPYNKRDWYANVKLGKNGKLVVS